MNPDLPNPVPSALEARITALLLGELMPEEAAEVQRDLECDPVLAQLHARLAQTIELVREAANQPAAHAAPQPLPAKLTPERREALLAKFKTCAPAAFASPQRARFQPTSWLALAAALVALLTIGFGMLLPSLAKAKAKAQRTLSAQLQTDRLEALQRAPGAEVGGTRSLATDFPAPEPVAGGRLRRNQGTGKFPATDPLPTPALLSSEQAGRTEQEAKTEGRAGLVRGHSAAPTASATPAWQDFDNDGRLDAPVNSTAGWEIHGRSNSDNDGRADLLVNAPPEAGAVAPAPPADEPVAQGVTRPAMDIRMMMRYGLMPKGLRIPEAQQNEPVPARTTAALETDAKRMTDASPKPAPLDNPLRAWYAAAKGPAEDNATATGTAGYPFSEALGQTAGGFGAYFNGQGQRGDAADAFKDLDTDGALGFSNADRNGRLAGGVPVSPAAQVPQMRTMLGTNSASLGIRGRLAAPAPVATPGSAGTISVGLAARSLAETEGAVTVAATDAAGLVVNAPSVAFALPVPIEESAPPAAVLAPARERGLVLGDVPQLGRMLTPEPAHEKLMVGVELGRLKEKPAPAATPSRSLAPAEEVRQLALELEPLPLKLPLPAFMGTPTDIPLGGGGLGGGGTAPALKPSASAPGARPSTAAAAPLGEVVAGAAVAAKPVESGTHELYFRGVEPAKDNLGRPQVEPAAGEVPPGITMMEREVREVRDEARAMPEILREGIAISDSSLVMPPPEPTAGPREDGAPALAPAPPQASPAEPQPDVLTSENAFSTFSLNVADVSFKLAAASLEAGTLPEAASIRVEEFVNAVDYHDPEPAPGAPIAFAWERAQYPFAHHRDLLRFSVQTAARGREPGRPLNLVLLLDNSGSMERADRVNIIREALRVLAGQLQPQDKISVVAFARTARLWVDGLSGNEAGELLERVGNLTPEGGTNLEDALKVGYETALRHFQSEGVNRVILLTDGAANLGTVEPEVLKLLVEQLRGRGVALDGFGIGWEGYNDDLLEVLTRHGDGRYGFVNTPEEAATGFADQLAGALQVAAADVKVQVEFNPARVSAWRQLGYAKHQLTQEQFRDNTVDAAEIGAAESGNALYAVEVNPQGQGPLGVVRVRYRVPTTGQYREHEWALEYTGAAPPLEQASATLRLAATAGALGEMLANSPFAAETNSDRLLALLAGVPDAFHPDPRPKKLEWMIRQAQSLGGR